MQKFWKPQLHAHRKQKIYLNWDYEVTVRGTVISLPQTTIHFSQLLPLSFHQSKLVDFVHVLVCIAVVQSEREREICFVHVYAFVQRISME